MTFSICFVPFALTISKTLILHILLFCCSKPKEMVNNMDGTWSIEIVPRETGKHELYVTVDGRPIKVRGLFETVRR